MRLRVLLAIAGMATLVATPPAGAATITVTTTSDGAGSCSDTSCTTLRAAADRADRLDGADTIALDAATYDLGSPLEVGSDVTLGGAGASRTAIRGDGASGRVVVVAGQGRLVVRHATIAGGSTEGMGGDVLVSGGAQLVMDHVRVTGGAATSGAGVAIAGGGSAQITHSLFDGNTVAADGGAILAVGNAQAPDGVRLSIADSTITGNSAAAGAGIVIRDDTRNAATLIRSTVADNAASSGEGAGISVADGGHFTATASIIAGNTAGGGPADCAGALTTGGWNVESGTSCGLDGGSDRQGADPLLGPLTAGLGETPVMPTDAASPAVDLVPSPSTACAGTDQRDMPRPQGRGCDAGAYELEPVPDAVITSGPAGLTNDPSPSFSFTPAGSDARAECRLDGPDGASAAFSPCTSPAGYGPLSDGQYAFWVRAVDAGGSTGPSASRSFTVDTTPPEAHVFAGPAGPTRDTAPVFRFGSTDAGATFECRLDGPGGAIGTFGPCTSPESFRNLAPGDYSFRVLARDGAGNTTETSRSFTVTAIVPEPPGGATPPEPPATAAAIMPEPQETVVVAPVKGRTLIKVPGSKGFVPLDATKGIPLGSTVDTRRSVVRLSAIRRDGNPLETALFRSGMFLVTQSPSVTKLRLVERLACRATGGASTAARGHGSRRLWGNGKGRFRTSGQFSSATVRGTKWLVKDSCGATRTKVARGVVTVRDFVRHRTVSVRAGHSYTARAARR